MKIKKMSINPIKYIRYLLKIILGWLRTRDKDHISFIRQLKETYTLLRLNQLEPHEYYMLGLYKPDISIDEKKRYMSINQHFTLESHMNPRNQVGILNKFNLNTYFARLGIPTPEMIGLFDSKAGFTSNGNTLKTSEDLKKLLDNTSITDFVIKPTSSGNAKGVMVCCNKGNGKVHVYGDKDYTIDDLYNTMIGINTNNNQITNNSFLLEKKVKQHKFFDNYSKTCTQSLRIVTLLTSSGDVEVVITNLKLAREGNYVDNLSVNMLCARVDEFGIIGKGFVFEDLESGKYTTWEKHPDTGYTIEGEKVPYYEEAVALAKKAQSKIPFIRFIGWDITITENGPLIFEGNYGFHIYLFQVVIGRGLLRNEFGKEIKKLMEK
jgi:hypothetical protein